MFAAPAERLTGKVRALGAPEVALVELRRAVITRREQCLGERGSVTGRYAVSLHEPSNFGRRVRQATDADEALARCKSIVTSLER